MDTAREKVKGEEMGEEDSEERHLAPLSSPPPLTSLLDSETGKMLNVSNPAAAAAIKKPTLEEAVERMKAATATDGVKSPEPDTTATAEEQ